MIYLLDTDHISFVHRISADGSRILRRLAAVRREDVYLSVVSYEEQTRGRLAEINRCRTAREQLTHYRKLGTLLDLYCATPVLQFDELAVEAFEQLVRGRPRVGTMDLKIAAIALANDATLLTRNAADFGRIPGLRFEDWSV